MKDTIYHLLLTMYSVFKLLKVKLDEESLFSLHELVLSVMFIKFENVRARIKKNIQITVSTIVVKISWDTGKFLCFRHVS